jgi:hypothetical protein
VLLPIIKSSAAKESVNRPFLAICVVLLVSQVCAAPAKPLKVFISAHMEGIGGVSTWDVQANAKGREYEHFGAL